MIRAPLYDRWRIPGLSFVVFVRSGMVSGVVIDSYPPPDRRCFPGLPTRPSGSADTSARSLLPLSASGVYWGEVEPIGTSVFTRQIADLLTDDEYATLQSQLAVNPAIGSLIRGGGGVRKVRVAVGFRGKRGGARVIYYWAVRRNVILLLFAYAKNELAGLTPKQVFQLANLVKQEFGNESKDVQ